ncbi:hypothetical protein ACIBQ0_36165 [Nocardia nova]|uniref:hypothetical protein n=1 Tax=Nocardia nova TaxID=37330 RepID=UPI003792C8B6
MSDQAQLGKDAIGVCAPAGQVRCRGPIAAQHQQAGGAFVLRRGGEVRCQVHLAAQVFRPLLRRMGVCGKTRDRDASGDYQRHARNECDGQHSGADPV